MVIKLCTLRKWQIGQLLGNKCLTVPSLCSYRVNLRELDLCQFPIADRRVVYYVGMVVRRIHGYGSRNVIVWYVKSMTPVKKNTKVYMSSILQGLFSCNCYQYSFHYSSRNVDWCMAIKQHVQAQDSFLLYHGSHLGSGSTTVHPTNNKLVWLIIYVHPNIWYNGIYESQDN